jgi:hypothetical protein
VQLCCDQSFGRLRKAGYGARAARDVDRCGPAVLHKQRSNKSGRRRRTVPQERRVGLCGASRSATGVRLCRIISAPAGWNDATYRRIEAAIGGSEWNWTALERSRSRTASAVASPGFHFRNARPPRVADRMRRTESTCGCGAVHASVKDFLNDISTLLLTSPSFPPTRLKRSAKPEPGA